MNLSHRAVRAQGWKWIAGMKAVGRRGNPTAWFRLEEDLDRLHGDWSEAHPDLDDPATVGCILSLVRKIWGPHASTLANGFEEPDGVWTLHCGHIESYLYGHEVASGRTEVEVLIKGLEIQP